MAERKLEYFPLENRAETGFYLNAPSLERLYIDCALSFTDTLTKLDRVRDTDRQILVVEGASKEILLVNWLNGILMLLESKKFLPKRIVFTKFNGKAIEATLFGDTYEGTRHGSLDERKPLQLKDVEIQFLNGQEVLFSARVKT